MTWNLICVALNTVELTENPAPSLIWCITRSRTCGALLFRLFSTSLDSTRLHSTRFRFCISIHRVLSSKPHYPRNSDLDLFHWYKSFLIEIVSRCVIVPHFYWHQWHEFHNDHNICTMEYITVKFDNTMNIYSRLDCMRMCNKLKKKFSFVQFFFFKSYCILILSYK